MAISSTTNRVAYTGNGVTTAFSFPYKFLENADLKVYLDGVIETLTTDYTVTGAGEDAGGTVTFLAAPASGEEVVILRDPAITQGLDLVENDPLPAEDVENAFDKLTMICQRLQDQVDRTLGVDDSVTSAIDVVIPTPDARKALIWNATSDGLINSTYDPDEQATLAAAQASAASASAGTASAASAAAGIAQTAAEAAQSAAEAAAATIPAYDSLTGEALNYVRLNAGETTMEFRTPEEARTDLGLEIDTDVQAYDADTAKTDVEQTWSQVQRTNENIVTSLTLDLDNAYLDFRCTPAAGGALTFSNIPASPLVQKGTITFVNGSNYAITAHADTKVGSTLLATISATGTYLLSYRTGNGVCYITSSGALA